MNAVVSIVIPVYNVEQYLEQCLESVLSQTYSNIEVIMINDGSTDNSSTIAEKYAESHDNFIYISQANSGQAVCRNKGIELAKGKYIYFLDSDDYILPNTIEKLIEELESNDLDIIRFSAEPFSEDSNYYVFKNQYDFQKYFDKNVVYEKDEFLHVNLNAYTTSPCLYITKKEIILKNNLRFVSGILYEDELFTLELFLNVRKAKYSPEKYYKRRYRANSVMTTYKDKASIRSFDSYYEVVRHMEAFYNKYPEQSQRKLIKRRLIKIYSILSNINVDKGYKKKKLNEITLISSPKKLFVELKYKFRSILKRIYFFIKK